MKSPLRSSLPKPLQLAWNPMFLPRLLRPSWNPKFLLRRLSQTLMSLRLPCSQNLICLLILPLVPTGAPQDSQIRSLQKPPGLPRAWQTWLRWKVYESLHLRSLSFVLFSS